MCCKEWTTDNSWAAYTIVKYASSHVIHNVRSNADKAALQKKNPDAKQMVGDDGEIVNIDTDLQLLGETVQNVSVISTMSVYSTSVRGKPRCMHHGADHYTDYHKEQRQYWFM